MTGAKVSDIGYRDMATLEGKSGMPYVASIKSTAGFVSAKCTTDALEITGVFGTVSNRGCRISITW